MNLDNLISSGPNLIIAISLLIIAIRGFRRLEAKVGGVHIVAEQVNKAVNNVGDGEPTLRNVVVQIGQRLDTHISESNVRLERIEEYITRPTTLEQIAATKPRKRPVNGKAE